MAERVADVRGTVYIVDADPAVREALTSLLEQRFDEVRAFDSAEALLDGETFGAPACLVTEVKLPGMDGLELLRSLGESRPDLPVILIAGSADVRTAVLALQNGAADFIEKPFVERVLVRRVRQALRRSGGNGGPSRAASGRALQLR